MTRTTTLHAIERLHDLPPTYRDTPIEDLVAYHNWGAAHQAYAQAELVVCMCMDYRVRLRIPENFAYVMRAAGAKFAGLTFQVSFAVAVGGARAIAVIGHSQCGMVGLAAHRETFVAGLVERGGWERSAAEQHFAESVPHFGISDATVITLTQAQHFRQQYPVLPVAAFFYHVEDGRLSLIRER